MNDNLYRAQILNDHECGSFKKRSSSVAPLSLFFLYFFIFCVASLALSIYLSFVLLGSFVCPLRIFCLSSFGIFCLSSFGIFVCSLWDLFLTLRATLYILQEV